MAQGLFGWGGMGGMSPGVPSQMAGLYDAEAARKAKLKSVMMNAGLSMLGQGPSQLPINFGTSLGQGLAAGVKAGDQTEKDYKDLAYQTFQINQDQDQRKYDRDRDKEENAWRRNVFEYGMKQDGINNAWMAEERNRKKTEWEQADAQKAAWKGFIGTLPPDEQQIASMYPDKFAQQFLESKFNTQNGQDGVFGNVYFTKDGKPYVLNKGGKFVSPPGLGQNEQLLDPYSLSLEKNKGAKVGDGEGEAVVDYKRLASKMPGLQNVVSQLGTLAEQATYTTTGRLWDEVIRESGQTPREAAVARATYIAMVDNQVLPLLRDTFGAAFTVKEGETLRATLGDPNASPEAKKAILQSFIDQKIRDVEALAQQGGIQPQAVPTPKDTGGMNLKQKYGLE